MRVVWFFVAWVSLLIRCLLGGALAVVVWPQLVFNDTVLPVVAKYVFQSSLMKGIEVHWDGFKIQVQSPQLLRKKLDLKVNQLCFNLKESQISGCVPDFQLGLEATFFKLVPRLVELGPLRLDHLKWKMGEGKKAIDGQLSLHSFGASTSQGGRFKLSGNAHFPGRARIIFKSDLNLIETRQNRFKLGYSVNGQYFRRKANLKIRSEGFASLEGVTARLSGVANHWLKELPHLLIENCTIGLEQKKVHLGCFAQAHTRLIPASFGGFKAGGLQVPTLFGVFIEAQLNTSGWITSANTRVSGPIQVNVEPLLYPLAQGKAKIKVDMDGVISEFPQKGKLNTQIDLKVAVPRFEKVVEVLRQGPWAIPAPLAVLKGGLEVSLQGATDLASHLEGGELPLTLGTHLNSKGQSLELEGTGYLRFSHAGHGPSFVGVRSQIDLDLILADVQLELPRLELGLPPRFWPDSRIITHAPANHPVKEDQTTESSQSPSNLSFRLGLRTRSGHPLRLMTHLAQAPIPIDLNLSMTQSAPVSGRVRVEHFPVEIFRRKAEIQYFFITLKSPLGESPLDGAVRVDYADYQVTLKFMSILGQPQIKLTSHPPLPENQLWSVLLFGKPIEELNSDQSGSIGATRQAVQESALSLASFYLFASTPIESVGYDPGTHSVSAKVRLAEGTSLTLGYGPSLGSQQSSTTSIGIRKQLGHAWTVSTEVKNSPDTGQVASSYLEWNHRY